MLIPVEDQPVSNEPPSSDDFISRFASGAGIDITDSIPAEPELPLPGDTPPQTPPPETPAPVTDNQSQAAKRIAQKEWRQKYEEAQARLSELEPLQQRVPELETSVAEQRILAEQRAEEIKKLSEAYRNEAAAVDPSLVFEVPEVREAKERLSAAEASFFPPDLSDVHEAEIRFDASKLSSATLGNVGNAIKLWEKQEYDSNESSGFRSKAQWIALSNIAKYMGVSDEAFDDMELNGTNYRVIRPAHPVYRHLKTSVRDYSQRSMEFNRTRESALTNQQETAKGVVSQRVSNTKKLYNDTGVGLTGEALKTAMSKTPDSLNLKVMALLENEPELLRELQDNVEAEASLNGHLRPQLDFLDPDPSARTAAATALMRRTGQRAINAPLADPLKKLVLKQADAMAELRKKIQELEAENARSLIQSEPGTVNPSSSESSAVPQGTDQWTAGFLQKLGIA